MTEWTLKKIDINLILPTLINSSPTLALVACEKKTKTKTKQKKTRTSNEKQVNKKQP